MNNVKLSVFRQLPPLLLFLLIAPTVVIVTEKGWLTVVIALAAAVLTEGARGSLTRGLFVLPLLYMAYYVAEEDTDRWYMSIKLIPALLASAGALAIVKDELYRHTKDTHAVRVLVYRLTTSISSVVGILYARELVRLMEEDNTLTPHLTTTRSNCTTVASQGFLFDDSPFDTQCPVRLWEHIRINTMLGVQLYVMYTLTTSMHDTLKDSKNKYAVGALVVTECLLWTLASALQFDTIENCHQVTLTTVVCLTLAAICNVFIHAHRQSTLSIEHGNDGIVGQFHSRHKLKL